MTNIYLTKIAESSEKIDEVSKKVGDTFKKDFEKSEKEEHAKGSVPGTAFQGKETEKEETKEVEETAEKAGKEVGKEMGKELAEKKASLLTLLKQAEAKYRSPEVEAIRQGAKGMLIGAAIGGGAKALTRGKVSTDSIQKLMGGTAALGGIYGEIKAGLSNEKHFNKQAEMGGEQRSNGPGIATSAGLVGAGVYGKSVFDRSKGLAARNLLKPGANGMVKPTKVGMPLAMQTTASRDIASGMNKIKTVGKALLTRFV